MPTIASLRAEGEALGLEGDPLRVFILDQQAMLRDERANERAYAQAMREAAAVEERAKLEAAENQKKRDHELELARLQSTNTNSLPLMSDPASKPKLPIMNDKEDINAYLIRFERVAELLTIQRSEFAVRLSALLSGRALKIYASLPPSTTSDYEELKKALLLGFNKTPEHYRQEFRAMRVSPDETFSQFAVRLGRTLDYWIDSRNVEKNFTALRSFIISDQILASVSPELRLFLKENNASDVDKITELADNWATARGDYCKSRPNHPNPPKSSPSPSKAPPRPNPLYDPNSKPPSKDIKCFSCGELGHRKAYCPRNPLVDSYRKVYSCLDNDFSGRYMTSGSVNGKNVDSILRDTGCSCILVSDKLFPDVDTRENSHVSVRDYLGRKDSFPVLKCYIECPYFRGWAEALIAPIKSCDVMIGNVDGVSDVPQDMTECASLPEISGAVTRSKANKKFHPLVVPQIKDLNIDPDEFKTLQQSCDSLVELRAKAEANEIVEKKDGSQYQYLYVNGLLYRKCLKSKFCENVGKLIIIPPFKCRPLILSVAHESPLAGHFSHRKTEARIRSNFFWPSIGTDVRTFCRSCDRCQRVAPRGRVKNVPMCNVPIISEPFSKVSIDLVGPFSPPSEDGHRYILTLIDYATGFPEALPLTNIDSISVAEALFTIFSRVGIPREILSDRGTQFTSQLMGELHRLLGVKPLFTSSYHPMSNGRVERLHSTLLACLKKLCADKPKQWHRLLAPTLFAIREMPSDRTGFSAFELLYGRQVRGPLAVLRDLWENPDLTPDDRTCFQYVMELKDKLQDCAELAAANADFSASKYKTYFDLKSQDRQFAVGDEVLILLPDSSKKLLISWSGPHKVVEKKSRVNYIINCNGKNRLYHANLLKKYHRRPLTLENNTPQPIPLATCNNCVIPYVEENLDLEDNNASTLVELISPDSPPDPELPDISPDLPQEDHDKLVTLLNANSDRFSNVPGCTNTIEHKIELMTNEPFRSKVYPVPMHLQKQFDDEVEKLRTLDIIQPSKSPYRSPIVMVSKADNTFRLTLDTRALNTVTVFDAEPMCNLEEELHKFTNSKFYSELDITKAYHQIKLAEESTKYTAFSTNQGLMEYKRMPFGLVTACATYTKLMRIVLDGIENVSFYFDNILIFSQTLDHHCQILAEVLDRLRAHNLTVKLSKCKFAYSSIKYLGFILGENTLQPQHDKIEAIVQLKPPTTKRGLRSFLGMVSFYSMFIPNMSDLTSVLTDSLSSKAHEPILWTNLALTNFEKLKQILTCEPVLKLPNPNIPFSLRTDASGVGLGALLVQYYDGVPFPVRYASRKLQGAEKNYSTIERECLAIVFGIQRFKFYLLGKEFFLEVDHRPLIYLNKLKNTNARLMRWALTLQPYRFTLIHIPGQSNLGADFLSRIEETR